MNQTDLLTSLRALDRNAVRLAEDEVCDWVRMHDGIVGLVRLTAFPDQLTQGQVAAAMRQAYRALDALPETELATDDLWNVTLVVAVPWSEEEGADVATARNVVQRITSDSTGARKLILWRGCQVGDLFSRLELGARGAPTPSGAPLHDEVRNLAKDPDEHEALKVLFKRKLSEEDVDDLVRVLGRAEAK